MNSFVPYAKLGAVLGKLADYRVGFVNSLSRVLLARWDRFAVPPEIWSNPDRARGSCSRQCEVGVKPRRTTYRAVRDAGRFRYPLDSKVDLCVFCVCAGDARASPLVRTLTEKRSWTFRSREWVTVPRHRRRRALRAER